MADKPELIYTLLPITLEEQSQALKDLVTERVFLNRKTTAEAEQKTALAIVAAEEAKAAESAKAKKAAADAEFKKPVSPVQPVIPKK